MKIRHYVTYQVSAYGCQPETYSEGNTLSEYSIVSFNDKHITVRHRWQAINASSRLIKLRNKRLLKQLQDEGHDVVSFIPFKIQLDKKI